MGYSKKEGRKGGGGGDKLSHVLFDFKVSSSFKLGCKLYFMDIFKMTIYKT
jgi:hypothetical protein